MSHSNYQVSPLSNSNYTRCLCDHLTSFGAGFFVPPNTISFDTVFDDLGGKLLDNNAVLITICVIFLLYLLVLVWARRKDKQDRIKVTALIFHQTQLECNLSSSL